MKRRLSVTNLSNFPMFSLNAPVVIRAKVMTTQLKHQLYICELSEHLLSCMCILEKYHGDAKANK